MLPCRGCAYRDEIPGDAHIRCLFAWTREEILAILPPPPRPAARWFAFPYNYDPVWGPDICQNRAETRDPEKTVKPNAAFEILSILGGKRL